MSRMPPRPDLPLHARARRWLAASLCLFAVLAALFAQSRPVEAQQGAQPAAATPKEEPGAKSREAALALVRGNLDQAIALFGEALDDRTLPNDRRATLFNDRGVAFARRGLHREAIEDYNRAIQLYPEFAAVYNNRGNLLLGLDATREAIKDFDRAIALAPGYAAAFSNRAGAHIRLGDTDRALSDYARAIELTPNSTAALNGRGRAHLAAFRPHAAIRDFTRAVNTDARFGPAYRSRGEAKLATSRFEDAIEDFSRAIAFDPRSAEIYVLRGIAYLEAENTASALKDFGTAIELAPSQAAPYALRGYANAKAEAFDEAISDLAKAVEVDPKAALAYAYRAWAYRLQQELDLAAREADRALKLDPGSAEGFWARGEVNAAKGLLDEAASDYRRALELGPRLKDARKALARLGQTEATRGALVPGAGLDGWRVHQEDRQFVALNDDFPRLRVSLEMMGPGSPRILEWQLRPAPFEGIGTLRFTAGTMPSARGPEEVEHTAIVDLQNQTIVSVQVHRQGDRIAKWTWEEGRVLVASADGITDELQLRQMKPKEAPPVVAQRPAPRKPKNFFEALFGFSF